MSLGVPEDFLLFFKNCVLKPDKREPECSKGEILGFYHGYKRKTFEPRGIYIYRKIKYVLRGYRVSKYSY